MHSSQTLSKESLATLEALQEAVTKTLTRKKKLGEYFVIWRNGQVVMLGDDAPKPDTSPTTLDNS